MSRDGSTLRVAVVSRWPSSAVALAGLEISTPYKNAYHKCETPPLSVSLFVIVSESLRVRVEFALLRYDATRTRTSTDGFILKLVQRRKSG